MRRLALPRSFGLLLLTAAAVAHAAPTAPQPPTATEQALAQALFDEGRGLLAAGDAARACPKLEQSQRLDPGGGTLLNLAYCHERIGKLATAWAEFNNALSMALRDGRADREPIAREGLARIAPRLPRVTVSCASGVDAVDIRLDQTAIAHDACGTPLPIDPGEHLLEASAVAKRPWSTRFRVDAAQLLAVRVPALEDVPVPPKREVPAAAPPPTSPPPDGTAKRVAGYAIGGAGVAMLATGAFFGLRSLSMRSESDRLCPASPCADARAVTLNDDARTSAWIANVGIGAGIVAVAIGVYFVLSAPRAQPSPRAAREGAVLSLEL